MLVGPHVSAAGELANAIANGEAVGATAIQIFTRSQRTWQTRPLEEEEAQRFRAARAASPIREVMSHDSYLINLGSPRPDLLQRSREAFLAEARRCVRLGIRLLNLHPGAHMGEGVAPCLARIAAGLRIALAETAGSGLVLVLENTAGQGSVVGATLEELAALLEALDCPDRTGVCLDTCHLFAAGYDIAAGEGWHRFWEAFTGRIGLSFLRAFHLNDAKAPLGSRKDRHEDLGKGHLGMELFRRLAADPRFFEIPMFLETPGGEAVWRKEIALLRKFRAAGGG
jgi:deoxyribonuclease-4